MPATTNVNYRTVVHKTSMGITFTFPDICKTPFPVGSIPIPYPNFSFSSDTDNGSKTVKCDGNPVMLKDSYFKVSTGDEPGCLGGIFSGVTKGRAEFITYSFDVKFENRNVCRLLDLMISNKWNTPPWPEFQPPILSTLLDLLADFFEAVGEFADFIIDIVENYLVPIVNGIFEGIVGFVSDRLIEFAITVVLVVLVVLAAPVTIAVATLMVTIGMLVYGAVTNAVNRREQGQTWLESVGGGVWDTLPFSDIFVGATGGDIITDTSYDLTLQERVELITKGALSLVTARRGKGQPAAPPKGKPAAPSKGRMKPTKGSKKSVPSTIKTPKTKDKLRKSNPDPKIKSDIAQRLGTKPGGRRGTPETRAHLDMVRDRYLEENPTHIHIYGGRDKVTGAQKKEEYLPPIPPVLKGPNGRKSTKGSSYVDLTFKRPDGTLVRINTVTVEKSGRLTKKEYDNGLRIEKQTGQDLWIITKGEAYETGTVLSDRPR